jgi:hypothetical protein
MQTLLGPHLCRGSWQSYELRPTAKARGTDSGDALSREQAKSITDFAEQEGVTVAYICRLLPLTCLAPDIVEAILDGRQPRWLKLAEVLGNGSLAWEEQRASWILAPS